MTKMILGVSRRTDIPAFHSEWFMNRLRAGYVLVRNPCYEHIVYRVELNPRDVDCLIFISKDPEPMFRYLDEMDRIGFNYIFQVTITPYGKDIEPGVRNKDNVIDSFIRLSERIGKERTVWRYDPILFNDSIDIEYHERKFSEFCGRLEGHTERCVFSFLDSYPKLEQHIREGKLRETTGSEMGSVGEVLAPIARGHGIEMTSCCTRQDLSKYGIQRRGCLDKETMRKLGIPYEIGSVPVREGCLCVKNSDVGMYDTCDHNCIYCYANTVSRDKRPKKRYDPNGEMLTGHVGKDDKIVQIKGSAVTKLTDFL